MEPHNVVSREQWLEARRALLAEEKAFTHRREALAAQRRALPWVRVEKDYRFDGPAGKRTLVELFDGKTQLLVYHFMFGPEKHAGCVGCSFWADAFDGMLPHLTQRDVNLVAVSSSPQPKLKAFAERMRWHFPWYSSQDDFSFDFGVAFSETQVANGATYNYGTPITRPGEMPGISVFIRDPQGQIFHTYSCYARGIDMLNPTYQYLDLLPKGRDEAGLPDAMAWVRHHDAY